MCGNQSRCGELVGTQSLHLKYVKIKPTVVLYTAFPTAVSFSQSMTEMVWSCVDPHSPPVLSFSRSFSLSFSPPLSNIVHPFSLSVFWDFTSLHTTPLSGTSFFVMAAYSSITSFSRLPHASAAYNSSALPHWHGYLHLVLSGR